MRDVNLIPALCSARKGHRLPGTESLPTHLILTDGGTQPRAGLRQEVIDEYAEAMMEGAVFPPVTVFFDGEQHWLADGFHRLVAVKQIGQPTITADVRQGTHREAVLHSVGANACHGLRRSNADKRKAVETLLTDPEWQQWSVREIAKQCDVSKSFVGSMRQELNLTVHGGQSKNFTNTLDQEDVPQSNLRKGADGRVINTANIGRRKASTFTNEQDNGAATSVKALPPFLPASPHEETSPPPVTTGVCAETLPTPGSDSEVSQPKVLLEESREPDPQPQPTLTQEQTQQKAVVRTDELINESILGGDGFPGSPAVIRVLSIEQADPELPDELVQVFEVKGSRGTRLKVEACTGPVMSLFRQIQKQPVSAAKAIRQFQLFARSSH